MPTVGVDYFSFYRYLGVGPTLLHFTVFFLVFSVLTSVAATTK